MAPSPQLELLKSGQYSDLILVCDGREFKVHRSYVCIVSSVIAEKCKDAAKVRVIKNLIMAAAYFRRMNSSSCHSVLSSRNSTRMRCLVSCSMSTPITTRAVECLSTPKRTETMVQPPQRLLLPLPIPHPPMSRRVGPHKTAAPLRSRARSREETPSPSSTCHPTPRNKLP